MKIETVINQIPALTWNWLKINEASVNIETSLKTKIKPHVKHICADVKYTENGRAAAKSIPPVETGAGRNIEKIFEQAETTPAVITAVKNKKTAKPVILNYRLKNKCSTASEQIIKAEENSDITVIIISDSNKKAAGFQAIRTKLYAARNSHIHLIKVQMLGDGFTQIDDTGSVCAENAEISVTHIILGGKETYTGVAAALTEYKAAFKSDTAYLCRGTQKLDMNYVAVHTGKKTDCRMTVKGTLKDSAQKTYRGTIDFRKGCTGATGDEQEETLLLSPAAVNKSIPIILCDEEDVAGEHGASIGRLGDDVLFYMQSRGLSCSAAEDIITRAKIQSTASLIPDKKTVQQIARYMDGAFKYE